MSSTRPHRSRTLLGLRAAGLVLALAALAVVLGQATLAALADAGGPLARPESGLVAILGSLALLLVARLVVLTLRLAVRLAARPDPALGADDRRELGRLERLVAGLLLGAVSLSPQVASAAPAHAHAGAAVAATAMLGDAPPVDPTYLGSGRRGAPTTPAPAATTPAPAATSTPAPPSSSSTAAPVTRPSATYLVRPGDTLWDIAEGVVGVGADDARVARAVTALYTANARAVGENPDLIRPGTRLTLPATLTSGSR